MRFFIEKSEQRASDAWSSRLKTVPETIEGIQWSFSSLSLPCSHLFLPELSQPREERDQVGISGSTDPKQPRRNHMNNA